ncbi:MAG: exosortase C-terminal domain/associated protein EpsI, partial [Sphingomonas sp.]
GYGVVVGNVCSVSGWRSAAFLAIALVVPVIANCVRAFGTIYAAWWTSVEQATGYDHIVYGWVFFGLVMVAVLAIGWRWFDRDPDARWFDPAMVQAAPRRRIDAPVAALLALAMAAAFLAWSGAIAGRTVLPSAPVSLPDIPGWHRAPLDTGPAAWTPNYPGADQLLTGRYVDESGRTVDLAVAVYDRQQEGRELVGFGIGAIRQNDRWVRIEDLPDLAGGASLRMTAPGPVERQVVTWYRVGGRVTASPGRVKLETLRTRLFGGDPRAVALLVSAPAGPDRDARAAIADFVRGTGPIDRLADRIAGTR